MKLSILQENFKRGLMTVSHIAGKNINLPILNNIMIKSEDNNIKLITTNLEIGITHTVRGKIEENGEITVDSKIITDYVGLLPNKKVNIEKKERNIKIECENYKTKINTQSAEEFPLIPVVEKKNGFSVNVDEFKKSLSQVIFAVSGSDSKQELSGVFLKINNGKITIAATDSYRLAEKKINTKKSDNEEEFKIIIPARTMQEVVRILSNIQEDNGNREMTFYISENQILFVINETELISRLIEGQYPDYEQIIPEENKTTAIVNKSDLVRAIKATSLFSKNKINDINLDFPKDKNKIIISATSGQSGESVVDLNASVDGEDNGITVNFGYLVDGLNNIDTENVEIKITNNNTPCVLRPEKSKEYLYIIMPIKQ